MSPFTLARPDFAAATDDGETMVVTVAIEQNLKDAPAKYQRHYPARFTAQAVQNLKRCLKEVPGVQLPHNKEDNRKA